MGDAKDGDAGAYSSGPSPSRAYSLDLSERIGMWCVVGVLLAGFAIPVGGLLGLAWRVFAVAAGVNQ